MSDAIIAGSYYIIPVALTYFVWKRKDVVFGWLFWAFALFILACGTTHWFDIWTLWHPDYGVQGLVKLATAALSAGAAVAVWVMMPRALALPSPSQYHEVTSALSTESEQRREVSRALEASEKRFQLLVESITDYAIFSLDRNGVIQDWNRGGERISGYRADEVIGRHFSIFYTPEDRDRGAPLAALEEAERLGRYEAETLRVRKDGSRFWANVVMEPIRDGNGALIGFAKITRDIGPRRELEERLRQAQRMEAVGQLTGGVAHDFNNHLMLMLDGLDRARAMATDNPALANAVELAIRGAERATSLTNQLLAFARRQPLEPTSVEIGRLLIETSNLLERTLGENIQIEVIRSGGLWPAYCDASQLGAALLNLAVNARDAMPDGGKLTIEAANAYLDEDYAAVNPEVTPGSYVMVAVTDTGVGMAPDVLEHAFEPFYTTKPEGEGTGLGLSQVFGFIKQSGGHVKLYSEPGHGTTVKLYVPRAAATAPSPMGYPEEPARGKGETVLVVEDDKEVREVVAGMVRDLGYAPLVAAGPEAALTVLRERRVDLLFTDVVMPGSLSIREFVSRARELRPGLRVLFTSGYTQNAIVHNGRLDDGVELLSKPYRREQLARRLRRLLDRRGNAG